MEYLSDICTSSTTNIRGTLFLILDFDEPDLTLPVSLNLEFKNFCNDLSAKLFGNKI